jgi:alkyl sulfatase BDS1-like metallo-beta-lactamase superfamily hydrolase
VEAMDFDILAPGHGKMGTKASVRQFREYMEDLHGQVLRLAREGKSVDDVKKQVDLKKYEKWEQYQDALALNIDGMYRMVQENRRPN